MKYHKFVKSKIITSLNVLQIQSACLNTRLKYFVKGHVIKNDLSVSIQSMPVLRENIWQLKISIDNIVSQYFECDTSLFYNSFDCLSNVILCTKKYEVDCKTKLIITFSFTPNVFCSVSSPRSVSSPSKVLTDKDVQLRLTLKLLTILVISNTLLSSLW